MASCAGSARQTPPDTATALARTQAKVPICYPGSTGCYPEGDPVTVQPAKKLTDVQVRAWLNHRPTDRRNVKDGAIPGLALRPGLAIWNSPG